MEFNLETFQEVLAQQHYISESQVATSIFLALKMEKPLLVEGPAGVGKTQIAKTMADLLGNSLIRLQCYEGIDASQAIYEWNYPQQLIHIKSQEILADKEDWADLKQNLYSEEFLMQRPLLQAITSSEKSVLLIDEIDRADEEFESFLLEILSDWQISIPEFGTISAVSRPMVVITSNGVRYLSDALRRRCLYLYIDYPTYDKEYRIIINKVPEIDEKLADQICRFMQQLREQKLHKIPGVAESLDWAKALAELHISALDQSIVETTLGFVIKDWKDQREVQMSLSELLEATGVKSKLA